MPVRHGRRAAFGTVVALPVVLVVMLLTAFLVLHAPAPKGANREPVSFEPTPPGTASTVQRD